MRTSLAAPEPPDDDMEQQFEQTRRRADGALRGFARDIRQAFQPITDAPRRLLGGWVRRPRGGDVGQTPPGGCANPPRSGE